MATTYEPIATANGTGSSATITFSSIPGTYTDIIIMGTSKGSFNDENINIRFNSDTGANYSWTILDGNGSSASSDRNTTSNNTYIRGGVSGTSNSANIFQINNYANTTTYKTAITRANNTGARLRAVVGLWRSTSAITSISLVNDSGNFSTETTFTIYGIQAA
jgi:predicted secreted protein